MRAEREFACDDWVLDAGLRPSEYAEHLLTLARSLQGRWTMASAVPMARSSAIETRLRAILAATLPRRRVKGREMASAMAIAAAVVLPLAVLKPTQMAAGPPPAERRAATNSRPGAKRKSVKPQEESALSDWYRVEPDDVDRARVISVAPAPGSTEVSPETEICVQFDRPMDPMAVRLEWVHRRGGMLDHGKIRYSTDNHAFAIPVKLLPGCEHHVVVNPPSSQKPQGFLSTNGVPARRYHWRFSTKDRPVVPRASEPRVVSVTPAPGSDVAMFAILRVEFDQAMSPYCYGLTDVSEGRATRGSARLGPRVECDAEVKEFRIPVIFPPSGQNSIILSGFRAATGVEAEPMVLTYQSSKHLFSAEWYTYFIQKRRDPTLRYVLDQMRRVRQTVTSLEETVQVVSMYSSGGNTGTRLRGSRSVFRLQSSRQFYGDVSQRMDCPFVVGSDGKTCWFRWREYVEECSFEDVGQRNLLFCDPLETLTADVSTALDRSYVEYLGTSVLGGRRCHRLQTWGGRLSGSSAWCWARDWWVDEETWMPVQLIKYWGGPSRMVHRFRYESVNKPIDITKFRPQGVEGLPRKLVEPLGEGYTTRFVTVKDGSNGRMSVRWGKLGPKGRYSGGLN